jgi:fibronectin type 3 domain-containing protein
MKKYSIIVLSFLAALHIQAQDMLAGLARPGAKGIFVLTGDVISDAKGPVTAYKIERKAGNDKDFTVVATLQAVATIDDFKKRASAADNMVPFQHDLSLLNLDSIWIKGKAAGTLAKLPTVGHSTPVLAGFNMLWLDEKVQAGKSYQYRVTAVGGTYAALSIPVSFNRLPVATPLYQQAVFNKPQRHMQLYWGTAFKDHPDFIETWRREDNGAYTKVPAIVGLRAGKDSAQYLIKDTSAKAGRLYRYFIKAYDVYGNAAPISDTITIASLDMMQMPMPQQVKAISDSAARAINISWQLQEAQVIKMLRLYRSTNSVKGFEPIAEFASTDTSFLDQQVQPATAYFYYFEVEYKTQYKPKRSTAFAGSFIDALPPSLPRNITTTGNKQGVELTWDYQGGNTTGFWLYRAERGKPLQLLTTMIPALDTMQRYTWTDTDSLLRGDRFYEYALKSFSTSHIESPFSDTVIARPLKNIPVPKPPMRVTAHAEDGRIYVDWDAVSYDETVSGYKLLRSKKAAGASNFTTDTILRATNGFVDTLVKPNETYRYSVITQSMLGVQSVPATWASVNVKGDKPAAPASLTANLAQTGIQLNWEVPAENASLQYNIYRYERGKEPVKAGTVAGDTDQFTDKTATKGKHYFYFIRSLSADKTESDKSNEASIRY